MVRWRARSLPRRSAPASSDSRPDPAALRKLLGRKVSLRYALADDPDFSTSELVGVVMSVDADDRMTVVDRRGNAREVAIASIQALKVFPA